jgi:hypothetical protein
MPDLSSSITPAGLSVDSILRELPAYDACIDSSATGQLIAEIFAKDFSLPGVLVTKNNQLIGLISRASFFEKVGKLFGPELFLNRPIGLLLDQSNKDFLVLPDQLKIGLATKKALDRDPKFVYEPIILSSQDGCFRLISVLTLFAAENQILITIHNQRLSFELNGLKISDEEAIHRFIDHANLKKYEGKLNFKQKYSVQCERCGQKIEYSIADIVRSHPSLNRGVEIHEKMGSRFYTFYLRHRCSVDILEIPVQHDSQLQFRNRRPARIVEAFA